MKRTQKQLNAISRAYSNKNREKRLSQLEKLGQLEGLDFYKKAHKYLTTNRQVYYYYRKVLNSIK